MSAPRILGRHGRRNGRRGSTWWGSATRFRVMQATVLARLQNSGYTLARMRFDIVFAPGAAAAYKRLKANIRAAVRDAIEMYLRHEPTRVSKSRIKRLRGLSRPQYRLRVGDIRVFYDVADREVAVLAIITKAQAESWLAQEGIPNENGGAGEG